MRALHQNTAMVFETHLSAATLHKDLIKAILILTAVGVSWTTEEMTVRVLCDPIVGLFFELLILILVGCRTVCGRQAGRSRTGPFNPSSCSTSTSPLQLVWRHTGDGGPASRRVEQRTGPCQPTPQLRRRNLAMRRGYRHRRRVASFEFNLPLRHQ